MSRRLISSAQPLERTVGYSRAVVQDGHVSVSGTVATMADGSDPPPDAYAQAKRALEIILAALAEAGSGPEHVVRTRLLIARPEDFEAVGRAHGELFGEIRPATTAMIVQLPDPRWLVEIEADAVLPRAGG
jgi:enamine deaminase RidA (YjgF/YER057c/UK114 family)